MPKSIKYGGPFGENAKVESARLTLLRVAYHNVVMFFTQHGPHRWLFSFMVIALVLIMCPTAQAKTKLVTLKEGVIVYSGPGEFYRPVAVLPAMTELQAGSKPVSSKNGSFYKVLVKVNEARTVIGYVSLKADVRYVDDQVGEDDLSKYGEIALVNQAIQFSYTALADKNYIYSLGYMKFLSPGFYWKAFVGQFSAPDTTATLGGGGIGNDALLFGPVSGLVDFSAGLFAPASEGKIFQASSSMNAMVQAAFGLRLNFSGVASLSVALTQFTAFNANNSFVSNGAQATLEVGL